MILGVGGQVTLEVEVREGVLEEVTLRWDRPARTEPAPEDLGILSSPRKPLWAVTTSVSMTKVTKIPRL